MYLEEIAEIVKEKRLSMEDEKGKVLSVIKGAKICRISTRNLYLVETASKRTSGRPKYGLDTLRKIAIGYKLEEKKLIEKFNAALLYLPLVYH